MITDDEPVQAIEKETVSEVPVEQEIEDAEEISNEEEAGKEEDKVPLSALKKERRKRQEAEKRAKLFEDLQEKQLREQAAPRQEVSQEDQYEAATKSDLSKTRKEIKRDVWEEIWIKENPEKSSEINENLENFLKQRPHLASAIENAPNRYEEAWLLMNALSPKQKTALKIPAAPKKDAPGSPTAVSKAAAINQTIDFSSMSDSDFNAWRQAQRKRR